jgi:hypothetical protein
MSTIKSSAENLTLNADGANNDIIFQSNGSNVATLDQAGLLTATTFAGSGASLTGLTVGLAEVDMWRLHTNTSIAADTWVELSSNLERCDTYGFDKIGTGMSESSGVFSFPSTGIWKIDACVRGHCQSADVRYYYVGLRNTTDNSTWNDASAGTTNLVSSGNSYANAHTTFIFDVTSTSTHKVKFRVISAAANSTVKGNSNENHTYFTFLKLGET